MPVDELRHGRVRERGGHEHRAEAQLGPQVPVDVRGGTRRTPRLQVGDHLPHPRRFPPVHLTDDEGAEPAVADLAGCHDVGEQVDERAHGAGRADACGDLRLVQAVLHGDDEPVGRQPWRDPVQRPPGGLCLDRQQDTGDLLRAALLRRERRRHGRGRVLVTPPHHDPPLADAAHVLGVRVDDRDLVPGSRQVMAEGATDGTGPHDHITHC
jgi:hypothetical protein